MYSDTHITGTIIAPHLTFSPHLISSHFNHVCLCSNSCSPSLHLAIHLPPNTMLQQTPPDDKLPYPWHVTTTPLEPLSNPRFPHRLTKTTRGHRGVHGTLVCQNELHIHQWPHQCAPHVEQVFQQLCQRSRVSRDIPTFWRGHIHCGLRHMEIQQVSGGPIYNTPFASFRNKQLTKSLTLNKCIGIG